MRGDRYARVTRSRRDAQCGRWTRRQALAASGKDCEALLGPQSKCVVISHAHGDHAGGAGSSLIPMKDGTRVLLSNHTNFDGPLIVAAVALVAAAAVIELTMGRVAMCQCGYVKLWHGVVNSAENSQHVTDWYTFSHVIHGIGFYGLLWFAARRTTISTRFLAAVFLEAAWEVFENTPFVIDRYRTATIALDYYGDSLVNSVSDILAMMGGFWIARRLPTWSSVALVITLEVFVVVMIRDNLTLNIVMLLYPLEVIRQWQAGTP